MNVKTGDIVQVEYEGFFDDGDIFDSSSAHDGKPLEFKVGEHQVILGFENAVIGKDLNQEFQIRIEASAFLNRRMSNKEFRIWK